MSKPTENIKYLSQKLLNPSLDHSKRLLLTHPHLLQTLNPSVPNQLYFEYASITLSQLISERKPTKLFIESDLLALMRGLSSVLSYLQINGVSHGNLHPDRIFFDEKSGVFKLYDEELLMGENCGFRQAKSGKKSFLAPELIGYYWNNQVSDIRGKCYKADVFALGLCVIEAACLRKSEEIYEIGSLKINTAKIDEKLMFIMKHYSREITHIMRMMVEIDEDVRPDPCELHAILVGGCEVQREIYMENKENNEINSIDLKKSWDSFENLYKNQGLKRVNCGENMKKSMRLDEKKEQKYVVYPLKNNSKKNMANSCVFSEKRGGLQEISFNVLQ